MQGMDKLERTHLPNDKPLGGFWPRALPPPSRRLAVIAFAVAGISDILSVSFAFMPPVQIAVDLVTAMALWILLGSRWPLLPALIAEAIPVVAIFPTWTMVAGAYLYYSRKAPAEPTDERRD